jgi:hypothetical protein
MPIMPQGALFLHYFSDDIPGPDPDYDAAVSGSKLSAAHCWIYCPYSTQITDYNQDSRVPPGDKVYHQETNGQMHSYSLGGGYMGWICADNDCTYYQGTATTYVTQHGRVFVPASGTTACATDLPTLSGSVVALEKERVVVTGTNARYFQI